MSFYKYLIEIQKSKIAIFGVKSGRLGGGGLPYFSFASATLALKANYKNLV